MVNKTKYGSITFQAIANSLEDFLLFVQGRLAFFDFGLLPLHFVRTIFYRADSSGFSILVL